uniref:aldehyde dehydrogenase (NAD(+)) n=1 Tax=Streptomyces clavuligerus TaxID=1901 RepID=O54199_STRCL|nr:piperideine-6-carboxilic acid dehydrogenase [Streptomyces clavuligerus]
MVTAAISGTDEIRARADEALTRCGVDLTAVKATPHGPHPLTGADLFGLRAHTPEDVDRAVEAAHTAFLTWRTTPAPVRGALVKRFGELLTEHKQDLADLVTIEAGKIRSEALGEVQEMIDICDFAVGLSRQLYGRTMPSERPGHRLMETWHPLGVVGVISAFNFPVAVWAWNAAVALVCGDTVVWKPSELTPLNRAACAALLDLAIADAGAPKGLNQVVVGAADVGERLVDSPRVPLVSATGSTRMGRAVGPRVAARFGRTILELGGNNAAVVTPSADLDLTVNAAVFAAAGTAGQRCTTLRRLIVHEDIADTVVERLTAAFERLPIGDPFQDTTLVGPLVNEAAFGRMREAVERATAEGGTLCAGGERQFPDAAPGAYYVRPALVRMPAQTAVVREETFAPILYVLTYRDLDEAIRLNNEVPQACRQGSRTDGAPADDPRCRARRRAGGANCPAVPGRSGTGAGAGGTADRVRTGGTSHRLVRHRRVPDPAVRTS